MASAAVRLRRVLSSSLRSLSTVASSLHPLTSSPISRPLPQTLAGLSSLFSRFPSPFRPLNLRNLHSCPPNLAMNRSYDDEKLDPNAILFEGCDYNHWLITMDFPKPKPPPEEMVETYVQTAAKVVGSVEEAKKRIYACSTTTYEGFQIEVDEETSKKFEELPGVVFVLPDSYIDPVNKEYGGDKYINGHIIPRPPPVQYGRQTRRTRNFDQQPRGPNQTYQGDQRYDQQRFTQGDGRNQAFDQQRHGQGDGRNQAYDQPRYGPGDGRNQAYNSQRFNPGDGRNQAYDQQRFGPGDGRNQAYDQQRFGPGDGRNQSFNQQRFDQGDERNFSPQQNYPSPQNLSAYQQQGPIPGGRLPYQGNSYNQGYNNQANDYSQHQKDYTSAGQRDHGFRGQGAYRDNTFQGQEAYRGQNQNFTPPPFQGGPGQGGVNTYEQGRSDNYGQGGLQGYGPSNTAHGENPRFPNASGDQSNNVQGEQRNHAALGETGVKQGSY